MEENSFGLSSHLMVEKGYDVNYNVCVWVWGLNLILKHKWLIRVSCLTKSWRKLEDGAC